MEKSPLCVCAASIELFFAAQKLNTHTERVHKYSLAACCTQVKFSGMSLFFLASTGQRAPGSLNAG